MYFNKGELSQPRPVTLPSCCEYGQNESLAKKKKKKGGGPSSLLHYSVLDPLLPAPLQRRRKLRAPPPSDSAACTLEAALEEEFRIQRLSAGWPCYGLSPKSDIREVSKDGSFYTPTGQTTVRQ